MLAPALASLLLAAALLPLWRPLPPRVADARAWLDAAEAAEAAGAPAQAMAPLRLSYLAGRWELPLVERRLSLALALWPGLPDDLRREVALELAGLADAPQGRAILARLRADLPPAARAMLEALQPPRG